MDLKIIEKKKNDLLKRTEMVAEMHEKTIPSKQQIREKLSAMLDISPEKMVITKVDSKFGSSKAKVYVTSYESAESLKKTEPDYIVVRNFGKEKKEGAEEQKNEAPANFKK
ncbi:MAG: 30S ribosomal protein S24e [archaeon]